MPPTDPHVSQPRDAPSFRARVMLELHGKTATGFELPADAVASLDAGRRPPIRVTLRGYTYRTSVGSRGGRHLVPVSAEHRQAAGISPGEELDALVELDTAPREVEIPDDLAAAFATAPAARTAFERLSFSQQQKHVQSVESAKTDETRRRRIAKVIDECSPGPDAAAR